MKVFWTHLFLCSCSTFLLDFQIFHVDISKQFTVILKTFLQITYSWQLSSEQELQSPIVITWVHNFSQFHGSAERITLVEMPKQKILELVKKLPVLVEEKHGNVEEGILSYLARERHAAEQGFLVVVCGTTVKMKEHHIGLDTALKIGGRTVAVPFQGPELLGTKLHSFLPQHSLGLSLLVFEQQLAELPQHDIFISV